ncbi:MAG: class I SAM-dependent DNA methyltransferase [Candidatus Acidiferrales bacterium]
MGNTSALGIETKLWEMADALRNNMDAAEYKHVVLGLIFLKYISDAFEAKHAELEAQRDQGADPEDPDEYRAASIFWVPKEARWAHLKDNAPQPKIGTIVDEAMTAIERDNPSLKVVLPKDYSRPGLDKQRLGQLINLVSDIGLGSPADRAKDVLGRVYEYFLAQFASAEGKKGGQFYTPSHVVRILVEMLAPYKGRVYDPCCGSGGMFVSSEKFIESHSGKLGDISIYGQESNYTTWRLAKMNLAIRGIDAQIAHGDTFHNDRHPDLRADWVLANPPFNDSDWRGELLKEDKRWVYGVPSASNANFAWVQHFIYHLAPKGLAGFVLANGSMSSNQSGEGDIREAIIEADLVDCMVSLPGQLFYSTQIPVCLWFLARNKKNGRFRDRRGETLFIDARKMGTLTDRVHRELSDDDVSRIAGTYHAWRGDKNAGTYVEVPGFCMAAKLDDIRKHGHVLTPGRYVGAEEVEDDGEYFEDKMRRLALTLRDQTAESAKLDAVIAANLKELGYGG